LLSYGHPAMTEPFAPLPSQGRVFTSSWPVRVGDVDTEGRLRLDGIGRYLQDLGNDDLDDGGARSTHPVWIVRRTVIDVLVPPGWPDALTLRRWCSGLSSSWCAERVQLTSANGGLIETEGFWINYSPQTQRPARLGAEFTASIGGSTDNHRLRWRRWLHDDPPTGPGSPQPVPVTQQRLRPFESRQQRGVPRGDRGPARHPPRAVRPAIPCHHRVPQADRARRATEHPHPQ